MIKPLNRNILIKLPDWANDRVRKTESGIYFAHLDDKIEHDASQGVVIAVGDKCDICQVNDTVFFDYYTVMTALQNCGRSKVRHQGTTETSTNVSVHYIENGMLDDCPELPKGIYIVMPENRIVQSIIAQDSAQEKLIGGSQVDIPIHLGVICLIRDGQPQSCNGYFLLQKAYTDGELIDGRIVKKSGLIHSVVLGKEANKNRKYKVLYAPIGSEFNQGDEVICSSDIEIKLEGKYNFPILPKDTFYCESELILAKVEEPVVV
jgi:co-chaperonin GroES (HSP10)